MTIFGLLSTLVSLAALFGLVSYRVLRLPTSIGTTILALCAAGAILAGGYAAPGLYGWAARTVGEIDFNLVVLHGMLAFLLFAGALQLNLEELSREKLAVFSLSIVATVFSTVLVAALFEFGLVAAGVPLSTMGALLFGALISPTVRSQCSRCFVAWEHRRPLKPSLLANRCSMMGSVRSSFSRCLRRQPTVGCRPRLGLACCCC